MPKAWIGWLAGTLAMALLMGFVDRAPAATFGVQLARAAMERTQHQVIYDGAYRSIDDPNGDVPDQIGVCTDLVIRSYRSLGIGLQRSVHEDMRRHFRDYPSQRLWGLSRPDPNIDYRRVPNLQVFLARQGAARPVSDNPADDLPGDLVTWRLPGNLPHIGVVSDRWAAGGGRRLMVHNIGAGPAIEDVLFRYPMTGHFRYQAAAPADQRDAVRPRPATETSSGNTP